MSINKTQINFDVHYPNATEGYVVYLWELEELKNGGESMTIVRDIMLNAFMLAIPLLINFACGGAFDALKAGNVSAILNLLAGAVALGVSFTAWYIYRIELKNSNKTWNNIMSRKESDA